MRKLISLAIAAMLTLAAVATWAASQKQMSPKPATESIGAMNPLDMMRKSKDLPVHNITDAF
jgi:hypothetical protein